jgi:excisionase family DNA binding protein
MDAQEGQRYLTVKDVVARTGLAERTVRLLIARGQLTIVRPGGLRAVRIPERSVMTLMSPREVRA